MSEQRYQIGEFFEHRPADRGARSMIFASEDATERFGSPEFVTKIPDEVISNLSIEISVFRAIWLSKNRPDLCPRRPGVGGLAWQIPS